MSKLTRIREALAAAMPDDLQVEVATGRQEATPASRGGLGPAQMILRVYTGAPEDPEAQRRLDALLDPEEPTSVTELFYGGDQTLGGLIEGLHVLGASGWRVYQAQNRPPLLGAEWTIQTR